MRARSNPGISSRRPSSMLAILAVCTAPGVGAVHRPHPQSASSVLATLARVEDALDVEFNQFESQGEGGAGAKNLKGNPLKECGGTTGFHQTGTCDWDEDDGGYHAVCVTMSETFLKESAEKDDNDLSSVVENGGKWCICAWAWASAVTRDATGQQGLQLDCDATNGRLRDVYKKNAELSGPKHSFTTKEALEMVNKLCE